MIGKIRALGLTVFLVAVAGAAMAAPAMAGKLDVGASPAVLTGTSEVGQEHLFTVTKTDKQFVLSGRCTTASFEGTVQGSVLEEATITATYGTGKGVFSEVQGCTVGGVKSQVLMNGCKYTITGAGEAANTAKVDIVGCTSGKQIEIKVAAGGCALKIPEQNGLSHVTGKQLSAQEATVETQITGVKVQQAGGLICPDGATAHTGTSGAFAFSTTLKAFQHKGITQVTKHQHQYSESVCGTQVAIQVT